MSRWFWITALLVNATAVAAPSHVGPTSDSESEILWQDGSSLFQESKWDEAASRLQRLIDRYSGHPHYLQAQKMLGTALLEAGNSKAAQVPLKYFIESSKDLVENADARALLGRAQFELGKFHEAKATSAEMEKLVPKLPKEHQEKTEASALILRAHALMSMNQDASAMRAITSARKIVDKLDIAALNVNAAWAEIRLKDRECERLPSRGTLNEGQIRTQLERRGLCIKESLLTFRKVLNTTDPHWLRVATTEVKTALRKYGQLCRTPPRSAAPQGEDISAIQQGRFQAELVTLLRQDCQTNYTSIQDMLKHWENELSSTSAAPAPNLVKEQLKEIGAEIERLKKSF